MAGPNEDGVDAVAMAALEEVAVQPAVVVHMADDNGAARPGRFKAPTRSQRSAIPLMKVILVARNALPAYLMSSAVSGLMKMIGVSIR